MPADTVENLLRTTHSVLAGDGVTQGDRLSILNGWGIGLLGILATIAVFVIAERRYGQRLRAERDERAQERTDARKREKRSAERASWQQEFTEIRDYQLRAERIADRVIAAPSGSRSSDDEDELKNLQFAFEAVARRCPTDLVADLQDVAEAVRRLQEVQLPSDTEVQETYRQALQTGGSEPVNPAWTPTAIGSLAVAHYQAAMYVREELEDVWKALRIARGEE